MVVVTATAEPLLLEAPVVDEFALLDYVLFVVLLALEGVGEDELDKYWGQVKLTKL